MNRINVVIRGAGVLVVAGVLATGAYVVAEGGEATTANAFVGTTAQTCTRSNTPITYEEVQTNGWVCGSLDAANDVMQNGDTAIIKGGSYGAQSVTGGNSRTAVATITVADGETATIGGDLGFSGARYLVVDGGGTVHGANARLVLGCCAGTGASGGVASTENQYEMSVSSDSDTVTIQGADFGGWLIDQSTDVTVKWNDIGPCHNSDGSGTDAGSSGCDNGSVENCTGAAGCGGGSSSGHRIIGNKLHDFGCDQNFFNGSGSDDCHWECMYVNYADDLVVDGNIFLNCANGGNLFNTYSNGGGSFTATHGFRDYIIQNNVFTQSCSNSSAPCGGRNGVGSGVGHCNIYDAGDDFSGTVIRYNTFLDSSVFGLECAGNALAGPDGGIITAASQFQFYGNVMKFPGSAEACGNNWDSNNPGSAEPYRDYNIFYSGTFTCGTNATNIGDNLSGIVVSDSSSAPDAHLTGASNTLDGYVPVAVGCPETDFEGDARASSGSCDAGADER